MTRLCQVIMVLGLFCLSSVPRSAPAVEAEKEQRVYVELCVAEVSLSKLRALGFDWGAIHRFQDESDGTEGEPRDFMAFLDALVKADLVQLVSHPRLATMSGRPASLQVGDTIKLAVVPRVADETTIQLEYRIELRSPPSNPAKENSACEFVLASATDLSPGKTCCVSQTRSRTTEGGKTNETLTVVLLRADLKPPADIRTAEKPHPPKPILERRYPEIEVPQRR